MAGRMERITKENKLMFFSQTPQLAFYKINSNMRAVYPEDNAR